MKINIFPIVEQHLATLYHADRPDQRYKQDIYLFYIAPLILGLVFFGVGSQVPKGTYELSITFFGIFIGLLLNIQIAIFSIFSRRWDISPEEIIAEIQQESLRIRRKLLSELNCNISYLVVFSCICLLLFLVLFAISYTSSPAVGAVVFMYTHFLLTMMMVIKRSHALFQREYSNSANID